MKGLVEEVAPGLPVKTINQFEESQEVEKRGRVTFCIVNQRPVESFFYNDKENFRREVLEALER
ncbi:MAG: hypothetical protein DRN55_06960 [Thermoplasmata archaeon]|nr:MAG: hypothetical protein DRN55_06960 [Thermoplasmata archaeon]